jgi:DHA1 family bicyclomycin/chloramphenicol resistance-like MFS transporter
LLCSVVAGVLSPLLSDSMLHLALGATGLTVVGALAWRWYRGILHRPLPHVLANQDPGAVIQVEIVEPH